SDIPIDPPLDVQSGDPPTTPADVPQASTTTTQQEPPSSFTVPPLSVPQPTPHPISTLISTFADIDSMIRTHGHSEINKGLERLLTCTQCYLVGRKRKRGRKGKGDGKYRKSEKFIDHGRIAKGVQIALQKSLPVDANTASAAIGVQHPDLPSGVAPFERECHSWSENILHMKLSSKLNLSVLRGLIFGP
ncbi:hypothetical protein ADUPG1_004457, partial [Aduncisulcus paluster]